MTVKKKYTERLHKTMKCPKCRMTVSRVVETKNRENGLILRTRECKVCKMRYKTIEVKEEIFNELLKMARRNEDN